MYMGLDGKLLYSRKTFNMGMHKPIVEWQEADYRIMDLEVPSDFETKCIAMEMDNKPFSSEFYDMLGVMNSHVYRMHYYIYSMLTFSAGLSDIGWYAPSIKLAFAICINGKSSDKVLTSMTLDRFKLWFDDCRQRRD